jgi:hypothetical protein
MAGTVNRWMITDTTRGDLQADGRPVDTPGGIAGFNPAALPATPWIVTREWLDSLARA